MLAAAAGTRVIPPQLFLEQLVSMYDANVPRLTFVSDGKPRRRLLIGSKKGIFKSDRRA
jgi:hypothetical protein